MKKNSKRKSARGIILKYISLALLGFFIYWLTIFGFSANCFRVIGMSMYPTLADGDASLAFNKHFGSLRDIVRNNIVIVNTVNKYIIKRVVGIPGDHIEIKNGLLYINDKVENQTYLLHRYTKGNVDIILQNDEYYVLGDNRSNSNDSRNIGPVNRKQIKGIVVVRWKHPIVP